MSDHPNTKLLRTYQVTDERLAESIEKDGTLIVEVNLCFTVHHAARCEVTPATLIELIKSQGSCETTVGEISIFVVNND